MTILRPTDLRVRWLGTTWLVEAPVALSKGQLQRVAKFIEKTQRDRWISLPHGEKREECLKTLEALQEGKLVCRVVASKGGEVAAFQSTDRTRPERSFFYESLNVGGDL